MPGKWKEFHFTLNQREKKLLYYEHQNVSADPARGSLFYFEDWCEIITVQGLRPTAHMGQLLIGTASEVGN